MGCLAVPRCPLLATFHVPVGLPLPAAETNPALSG